MPHTTGLIEVEVNHLFNVEIGTPGPPMVTLREGGIERLETLVEFNYEDAKGIT